MDLQSLLGYSQNSPFFNNPYLDIHTPDGSITMENTPIDLWGIDNKGNKKKMKKGRKNPYRFEGDIVREIPVDSSAMQGGGPIYTNNPDSKAFTPYSREFADSLYGDYLNFYRQRKDIQEDAYDKYNYDILPEVFKPLDIKEWRTTKLKNGVKTAYGDAQDYTTDEERPINKEGYTPWELIMKKSDNPEVKRAIDYIGSRGLYPKRKDESSNFPSYKPNFQIGGKLPKAQLGKMIPPATGDMRTNFGIRNTRVDAENERRMRDLELRNKAEYVGPTKKLAPYQEKQAAEKKKLLNQMASNDNLDYTTDESGDLHLSEQGLRNKAAFDWNRNKFARSWETPLAIEAALSGIPSLYRLGEKAYQSMKPALKEMRAVLRPSEGGFRKTIRNLPKDIWNYQKELRAANTEGTSVTRGPIKPPYSGDVIDAGGQGYISPTTDPALMAKEKIDWNGVNEDIKAKHFGDKYYTPNVENEVVAPKGEKPKKAFKSGGNLPYMQDGGMIYNYLFDDNDEEDLQEEPQQQEESVDNQMLTHEKVMKLVSEREQADLAMQEANSIWDNPYKRKFDDEFGDGLDFQSYGKGINPYTLKTEKDIFSEFPSVTNLGIWGDSKHQARKSDHNTGDAQDFGVSSLAMGQSIVTKLAREAADRKVKYIIFNRKIWNPSSNEWRPYTGDNPHTDHVHVSYNR